MGSLPGGGAMKLHDMYEIVHQQHMRDSGDWKLEDIQRPIPASGNRYSMVGGTLGICGYCVHPGITALQQ